MISASRVSAGTAAASSGRDVQKDASGDHKECGTGSAAKEIPGAAAAAAAAAVVKEKETKELKCPDCTYVAKSHIMFEKHVSLHSSCDETKLALCELCGVVKLKVSMGYHMKRHEPRDSGPSGTVGKST